MNVYFLVEGKSTERKIYPKWLGYLVPELKRVKYYDQVKDDNYYLISGNGYPNIVDEGVINAVEKIREFPRYDYLVICVDADEESVEEREQSIRGFFRKQQIDMGKTKVKIIVQNRCIETWLLGNKKFFDSRQPLASPLLDYVKYYDVSRHNPEAMGRYKMKNHSDFHLEYLKKVFAARNCTYTKKFPQDAQKQHYFEELERRVLEKPQDLKSFQIFLALCREFKENMTRRTQEQP